MKKIRILLLLPVLFLIVACSKSPKEEFISRIKQNADQDKSAYQFSVKIKDIQTSTSDNSESIDMSMFKGASLNFQVQQDLKNEKISISTDLSKINAAFPKFNLFYVKDTAYLNADAITTFYGLDSKNFEGKYIDLAEFSNESFPKLSELSKEQDYSWIEKLSDKKFKKDGDKVTATLSFDELLKVYSAQAKKDEELKTYIDLAKASVSDDSKITMTLDKDGSGNADIKLVYAKALNLGIDSIHLTMTYKKSTYKDIKVPNSNAILSQEELGKLVEQNYKMSDEQFEGIYNSIKESTSLYSKEELQELINSYKTYLTDEQFKKLQSLLDQVA
ncbi:hypothetical protein ACVRXS_01205 [Streptococcus orisratti]|uniref:hypothetical protein n=1 Tax=Streptococcus orisratti TaxID=114652 RepID=UPI000380976C|nr:hypothetical protein [Streptococcus orisratti]